MFQHTPSKTTQGHQNYLTTYSWSRKLLFQAPSIFKNPDPLFFSGMSFVCNIFLTFQQGFCKVDKRYYPIFNRDFHYKSIHFGGTVPLFLETTVYIYIYRYHDEVLHQIFSRQPSACLLNPAFQIPHPGLCALAEVGGNLSSFFWDEKTATTPGLQWLGRPLKLK